jgi:hypothetical protein
MKMFIAVVALLFFGAKYTMDYLTSEKFQEYGDRTKAPWTCEVNMIIAQFHDVMSHYQAEQNYLQRILDRCPDSPVAEEAAFDIANALEKGGSRVLAIQAYEAYAEKYGGTKRGRLATKAANILKTTT